MIKAAVFDLDDTLFDSTDLSTHARRAAVRAMIGLGLPVTFDEAYQVLTEVVQEYGSNYNNHFDQMLKRLGHYSKMYVSAGVIAYHDVKFSSIRPFPDVIPTFIELKRLEIKICVLTDGDALKQYEKILRLRIQDFLDDIIITEEVGIRKPNPKVFELALSRLSIEPNECFYIGDNYERDIVPCIELGIRTALIHRGGKYDKLGLEEEGTPPDYQLKNLKDLIPIIKELNSREE